MNRRPGGGDAKAAPGRVHPGRVHRGHVASTVIALFAIAAVVAAAVLAVDRFDRAGNGLTPPVPHRLVTGPIPGAHPYLGVFERAASGGWAPVAAFEKAAGVPVQIVLSYSAWGVPFPAGFADRAVQHSAVPFIQIMPKHISMAGVAAGRYDPYLHGYADQVKQFGEHVILSFAPEMNGWWYSWGWGKSPAADFVAAWRHVVRAFRAEGATNVTWMWTVNRGVPHHTGPLKDYWPGDQYVDWVGIDGYYFLPGATFGGVFGNTIGHVRRLTHRPVLLSEAAIGPQAGQVKCMPGLFAGIRAHHLDGLVWFDARQHAGIYHQDWRLEGHPQVLAAFRAGARAMLRGTS